MLDLGLTVTDRPVVPGQYRYVATHAWWLGSFGPHQHLTEHRLRLWVPAHPDGEWVLHRELTGAQTWLTGSAEQAHADGFELRGVAPTGWMRAARGDFDADGTDSGCATVASRQRRGSWQSPTPEFLARLPRDPDALLARLREDNPGSWFGPFAAAVTALRTALVPADLRAAFYPAMTGLPGVSVAERALDVDGQECLALVHDAGRTRTEVMIDRTNGQFAGERDTLRADSRCGLPAGSVISTTAVRTAVVDGIGEPPGPDA